MDRERDGVTGIDRDQRGIERDGGGERLREGWSGRETVRGMEWERD